LSLCRTSKQTHSRHTLIKIEASEESNLSTEKAKKLEEKLQEIRNQYFIATTAQEKKNSKKNRELRKALAEDLAENGWEPINKKNLPDGTPMIPTNQQTGSTPNGCLASGTVLNCDWQSTVYSATKKPGRTGKPL
jgi:hypothetical protein